MATTSNPYRRKQDAILGIDISNQHSRPTSSATLDSQSSSGSARSRIFMRKVSNIPAQITQFQQIPEHQALNPQRGGSTEDEAHNLADIRREIASVYNGSDYQESFSMSPTSETHDPLEEDDEDEDDDEEEYDSLEDDMSMYAGSVMPRRRLHQSRRMAELQEGSSSIRSTSALGFRSNSTDSTALPSKAERMLGMAPKRAHSTALAPRISKSKKGGLAPKAQRLLGVKAETIKKASKLREEQGMDDDDDFGSVSMTMGPGVEVDDFKRLLLAGRSKKFCRRANTESVSDASSMSRSSFMDSQTSRSSREMLSPDTDTLTWTAPNSAPPPWLGVHPAFRKKTSVDSEMFSPISPHTVLGKNSSVEVPMYANFNSVHDAGPHQFAVELDAGPIGPPSPVELAVPETDLIARSVPSNVHEMSSLPPSPPRAGRPKTSDNRLAAQTSSSSILATAFERRPSSADDASPTLGRQSRQERPSAIFDNPNIFEMAAEVPMNLAVKEDDRPHRQLMHSFPSPPTPPPSSGRSASARPSRLHHATSASPPQQNSPYAPPQRPLPALPGQRSTSGGSVPKTVDFNAERSRKQSVESLLSPTSGDNKSLRSQPSLSETRSNRSNPENAPPLTALSVPSPLAMALAEGRPITKEAPPPLRSPEDYPPTKQKLAAQAEKIRVELSDKKAATKSPPKQRLIEDDEVSIHRPFSWQSTRSTRTTRSARTESDVPMPPPLALKIPTDDERKAASHIGSTNPNRSGAVTATPLTATSARSRASRLEKALESALSKDGMDKALSGEKIEDLFRSAGAEELFLDCSKESRELIGLEPGEDTEEARQAAVRAQELLTDLGELQKEVDQLRKLYADGGPLEGMEGVDFSKVGANTI